MTSIRSRCARIGCVVTIAATMLLTSTVVPAQQAAAPGATSLQAEADVVRRYAVELIIFEYVDGASSGTEIFDPEAPPEALEDEFFYGDALPAEPLNPDRRDPRVANDGDLPVFGDPASQPPAYEDVPLEVIPTYERAGLKILGPESYVLDDEYARLERLDAYRPLMRVAWSQPTLEKEQTLPIKLRRLGNPPLRLDGTVTLYLSRFLHLVVDLALEDQSAQRTTIDDSRTRRFGDQRSRFGFNSGFVTTPTYYRIVEDRIVRNGELRYYDHPRFGVLAKITRVEDEDASNDPASRQGTANN